MRRLSMQWYALILRNRLIINTTVGRQFNTIDACLVETMMHKMAHVKIQRHEQKQVILTQTKPPLSQQYPCRLNSVRIFNVTVYALFAERSPTGRIFASRLSWWNEQKWRARQKSAGRFLKSPVRRGLCELLYLLSSRPAPGGRGRAHKRMGWTTKLKKRCPLFYLDKFRY